MLSCAAAQWPEGSHRLQVAERGIVYIDEVDKIVRKSDGITSARDVSGEGVQQVRAGPQPGQHPT